MAVRNEVVRLTLEGSDFTTGMARAAASTALLNRELGRVDGASVSAGRGTRQVSRDVDTMGASMRRTERQLDSMSGRMGLLAEAAIVLGPSLVPLGAIAAPAVAGLASGMGSLALGVGAAVLAFQGFGGALKAVNAAALNPTAENLDAAREALKKLTPAAAEAVRALADMRPVLDRMQRSAATGFFPGFTESLGVIEDRAPELERIVSTLGEALGDLLAEGSNALSGSGWDEFFRFLATDARDSMVDMGHALGNLTEGLAQFWMSSDRLNDMGTGWLVDATASFADWAAALDQTQGFHEFVAYIEETGPQLGDTLGAIGSAFLDIAEAAAPLGGPVLAGLEAFADLISAIADSNLGTPIMAGVTALLLLNRTLRITDALMRRQAAQGGITGMLMGANGAATRQGLSSGASSFRSWSTSMVSDARALSTGLRREMTSAVTAVSTAQTRLNAAQATQRRAGSLMFGPEGSSRQAATASAYLRRSEGDITRVRRAQEQLTSAQRHANAVTRQYAVTSARFSANTRTLAANSVKAGAGVGALALVTSGAANDMGLANTATLGLAGSMFGPWGTAIGMGVGAVMDFSAAQGKSADAARQTDAALAANRDSVMGYVDVLSAAADEQQKIADDASTWNMYAGLQEASGAALDYRDQLSHIGDIGRMLGQRQGNIGAGIDLSGGLPTDQELRVLENAAPAMKELGIEISDLESAYAQGGEAGVKPLIKQILAFNDHVDSGKGRAEALADAVSGLGDKAITTAGSASALAAALSDAFSPRLDAEAANDAWHKSLGALQEQLDAAAGFKGYSDEAMGNREASAAYMDTVEARLVTMAGLTTTTETDMAKALAESRDEFIKSGVAAGINADVMRERANAMELTPKLIETVFQAEGIEEADRQAYKLRSGYEKLPPEVVTLLGNKGVDLSRAEIEDLGRKYKDFPGLVETLVDLKDAGARLKITDVAGLLKALTDPTYIARLTADGSQVPGAVSAAQGHVNSFKGKEVWLTTYTQTVAKGGKPKHGPTLLQPVDQPAVKVPKRKATGGPIIGPGSGTSDDVPIMASNGEFMHRTAAVQYYGPDFMHDVNAMRFPKPQGYATGGLIGGNPAMTPLGATFGPITALHMAIKLQTQATNKLSAATDKATAARDEVRADRDSLRDSVSGKYMSELFGQDKSPFLRSSTGVLGTLQADNANYRRQIALQAQAKKAGLSGDAFAELVSKGSAAEIQALLAQPGMAKQYQRDYDTRTRLAAQSGNAAGDAGYGAALAAREKELQVAQAGQRAAERRGNALLKELKSVKAEVAKNGKRQTGAVRTGKSNRKKG